MNDYSSDQAKELRRARLLKVKPKAAPMMLTESEFNREYTEYRFVSIEHLTDLEEANNVMFCPACARDVNNVMGKRRVLHISYEEDPLGNFPLIAVAKCQGCEWEEMIPVVKQELTDDERTLLRRFNNAQGQAKLNNGNPGNSKFVPGVWADEMLRYGQPGQIAPMKPGQSIMFAPLPDRIRFGQSKAERTWAELGKNEQERKDVENAKRQLDMIEEIEKQQRQSVQSRAVSKSAMLAQAYGMGQSRLQDLQKYNDDLSLNMAQNMDRQLMQQMQNYSLAFPSDKEPAEAAKAAHRVLIDKVKKMVGK